MFQFICNCCLLQFSDFICLC